jgi:hypothetical protein
MLSTLSATDTRGLCLHIIHASICLHIIHASICLHIIHASICLHIIHMSICLMTVECEVSTSSTAGIRVIDTPSRHRVEDKSTVSNTVGPATQIYALCSDNLRIYGHSKYLDGRVGATSSLDTLRGLATSTHIFAPALATSSGAAPHVGIYSPSVRNMLGGCTSNWHSFTPALATRSGAASHSGIYSPRRSQHARGLCLELTLFRPCVCNTLGGCASNWHSFALALATCSGATLNARILVAIYQFGCHMSNTKVSPNRRMYNVSLRPVMPIPLQPN